MNEILKEYLDIICMGILDDVIIYSQNLEEHVQHVRSILAVLRQHRLYAKIEKCEFHKPSMTFVGFLVSSEGIGMDPVKVSVVTEGPTPRSVKEVQSFLGFANFYRKFIADYSAIASPLTNLTRKVSKTVRFTWTPAAEAAFIPLQQAFISTPILQHFQPSKPLTIEADASDFALGCIFSQTSAARDLLPICFYSKKFTPAEFDYPIYDKELLAVVEAFT